MGCWHLNIIHGGNEELKEDSQLEDVSGGAGDNVDEEDEEEDEEEEEEEEEEEDDDDDDDDDDDVFSFFFVGEFLFYRGKEPHHSILIN